MSLVDPWFAKKEAEKSLAVQLVIVGFSSSAKGLHP